MKMKLTNYNSLINDFKNRKEVIENNIVDRWFDTGLKVIKLCRSRASFNNWTNNLRSSFGVAVFKNGQLMKHSFELVGSGSKGDGREGLNAAMRLVNEINSDHTSSVLLILVAAEKYAGYVERTGRSVLSDFVASEIDQNILVKVIDIKYGR